MRNSLTFENSSVQNKFQEMSTLGQAAKLKEVKVKIQKLKVKEGKVLKELHLNARKQEIALDLINQFPHVAKYLNVQKIRFMPLEQLLRIQARLTTDMFHATMATKL